MSSGNCSPGAPVRAELAAGAIGVHDAGAAAVRVNELVDRVPTEVVGGDGLLVGAVAGRVEVLEAEVDGLGLELPVVELLGIHLVEHVVEGVALLACGDLDEVLEVDVLGLHLELELLGTDLLGQLDGFGVLDLEGSVDLDVLLLGTALDLDLLGDDAGLVLVVEFRLLLGDGNLDLEVGGLLDHDVLAGRGDRDGGCGAHGDVEGQVLGLLGDLESDGTGGVQFDGCHAGVRLCGDERLGARLDLDLVGRNPDDRRGHPE